MLTFLDKGRHPEEVYQFHTTLRWTRRIAPAKALS
jgi:hypothetical protein